MPFKTFESSAVHPGYTLGAELKARNLSIRAFAKALNVPFGRIATIIRGTRNISAETALRLGYYFDMDPLFWMNMQMFYDLAIAKQKSELMKRIKQEVIRPK